MSWSKEYKTSINCSNPKGFSQKAHCDGRKARQAGKQTQSKSVSEMKLTELKEQIRTIVREKMIREAISSFKLGSEEYTKRGLTPTDIHSLAMEYVRTSGNKMYGGKMEKMIKVGNDLARLLGTTQLSTKERGPKPALILVLLKNGLVDKSEYIKLYNGLKEKQESVIKSLKNADPASRMVGGAAARQAHKDMKGEFEEGAHSFSAMSATRAALKRKKKK